MIFWYSNFDYTQLKIYIHFTIGMYSYKLTNLIILIQYLEYNLCKFYI